MRNFLPIRLSGDRFARSCFRPCVRKQRTEGEKPREVNRNIRRQVSEERKTILYMIRDLLTLSCVNVFFRFERQRALYSL